MDPNHSLIAPDVPSDRSPGDLQLLVTELPRFSDATVLRSELYPKQGVAVISYPTLGVLGAREGLAQEMTRVIQEYRDYRASSQGEGEQSAREEKSNLKTMLGMIATNQPRRSLGALSGALAAGIGVGAFGIFYSSIWEMADYLTVTRLAVVNIVAVLAMILWLLLDNSLWDKPSAKSFKRVIALYNGSTLITLAVAVLGDVCHPLPLHFRGRRCDYCPGLHDEGLRRPGDCGDLCQDFLARSIHGCHRRSPGVEFQFGRRGPAFDPRGARTAAVVLGQ